MNLLRATDSAEVKNVHYRGTSLIRNTLPKKIHHRSLGIGLLQGPTEGVFLMSKVTL